MLTCKEFDNFMIDYLEKELPVWQKFRCWLHTKICRECAYFIRQYRRTVALEQSAFDSADDLLPESVPEELIKAALAHRGYK